MRGDGTGRLLFPVRSTEERSHGQGRSSSDKAAVRKLSDGERKKQKNKNKLIISAFAVEDPVWVLGNHKRLVHKMSVVN